MRSVMVGIIEADMDVIFHRSQKVSAQPDFLAEDLL